MRAQEGEPCPEQTAQTMKAAAVPLAALALALLGSAPSPAEGAKLKSVLMFAVDDLRTQLSVYPEGGAVMKTPNFDRIAKQSVVFERAYIMVSLCMPSRTSLLTSRRPDTSRSWTIETDQYWRLSAGNFTTLPERFMQSGYLTLGMGKIFRAPPLLRLSHSLSSVR